MSRGPVTTCLARVLGVDATGRPRLRTLDAGSRECTAEWAIPWRYEPAVGDLLQVIAQGERCFVLGVVQGHGRSQVVFRGDAALAARGALHLHSDAGVRLRAPRIELQADACTTDAGAAVQRATTHDTVVRGECVERAGQCARTLEGDDVQLAGTHRRVANHAVKIDGELLRLS